MRSRTLLAAAGLLVAAATALALACATKPPAALAAHALAPHALVPHALAPHALAPHALAPHALAPHALAAEPAPSAPPTPAITAGGPAVVVPAERADAHLVRSWRAPLAGGLLTFPPSFHAEDGAYDLVIHLNGNTDLVEESFGYAGVNAVVMILNLGVGSGVYEDRFADPAAFPLVLSRVQNVLTERGLRAPRLRRVAVSAWSSGYGGVIKLLQQDDVFARLDAVVLFDSIHCGYAPGQARLKPEQIDPIRRFARRAADGEALLSITHSDIATYGYLDAHGTTDVVLASVGLVRVPTTREQPWPHLRAMTGVMPKSKMHPLTPLTEAHRGGLHVRGYDGSGPITHMLHLAQMSTTALPDLVAWWKG